MAAAWKRLTANDSGTYSLTVSNNTINWGLIAVAFSGRDTLNPPVGATAKTSTASNASPITMASNAVTVVSGDDLVWIAGMDTLKIAGTAVRKD